MFYEDKIERRTIRLTTVTPIHIKGKNIDYGQGFVRCDSYSAYAIDHTKLGKYLLSKGKFEVYIEQIDRLISRRKFKDFDFQKFLQDHNLYHIDKPETHRELIRAGVFKGIVNTTNDKRFILDGLRRAFIPGSSIKGFIRVAFIYDHFKNKLFANSEDYEKEIRDYDRRLTEDFRYISVIDSAELDIKNLNNETVSIISRNIREEKKTQKINVGEGRIIEFGKMKLQVGDVEFYDIDESLINRLQLRNGVVISSFTLDKKGKKIINLVVKKASLESQSELDQVVSLNFKSNEELECFNGETEFDIIINKNHKSHPFESIENIIQVLDSFSQKIWDLEAKYFTEVTEDISRIANIKAFYSQPRIANVRLGFGTGIISKTPAGILEQGVLTNLVNSLFEPKKDPPHTRPKSRKIISLNNNGILPLGWARLDLKQ